MTEGTCSVEGCDRARSKKAGRGMCGAHYQRWQAKGDPGPAEIVSKVRRDPACSIVGCDKPHRGMGYCQTHYWRFWKNGDPEKVKERHRSGEDHPSWVGDDAGYAVVHQRINRERGSARGYWCAHCDEQAKHWAYDKTDPNPKFDDRGCPYSTDVNRYMPLCISCHWRFDRAVERLRKVT